MNVRSLRVQTLKQCQFCNRQRSRIPPRGISASKDSSDDDTSTTRVNLQLVGIVATMVMMQPLSVWSAEVVSEDQKQVENEYIQKLLDKSERLREERREERLQHYYKKNFSEYFDYTGPVSSELQDQIDQWKDKAESIP